MARRSTRRRRRPSSPSPVPAAPLEDDNLLGEILLRLPAQPPHLLRASLVSKRWRGLATDPKFLHRFRIHHRKPPLLGLLRGFTNQSEKVCFRSTLDSPYRIPHRRFSLRDDGRQGWSLVDCRHGRLLFEHWDQRQAIVWDPITDDHCFVAVPPQFHGPSIVFRHWAVLCAAGEQGHVHGCCHWSPFKLVLVATCKSENQAVAIASVYSSETGIWGDHLSTAIPLTGCIIRNASPSILVGSTLHWSFSWSRKTAQFDLVTQRLAMAEIERPPGAHYSVQIIHSEDGGVAFATLSRPRDEACFQMWEKKANCYGVPRWVLLKSVELQSFLGLGFKISTQSSSIVRYAEDARAIFLRVHSIVYMVQLKTMQSKELFFERDPFCTYHPFTSFSTEVEMSVGLPWQCTVAHPHTVKYTSFQHEHLHGGKNYKVDLNWRPLESGLHIRQFLKGALVGVRNRAAYRRWDNMSVISCFNGISVVCWVPQFYLSKFSLMV